MHLTNINVPKEIEEQEKLIEEARSLKAEAVKSQNFELAASYRDREKELSVRLEEMKVEWEARLKDDRQTVGEEEIANVISMMSGVPVQRMAQAEGLKTGRNEGRTTGEGDSSRCCDRETYQSNLA